MNNIYINIDDKDTSYNKKLLIKDYIQDKINDFYKNMERFNLNGVFYIDYIEYMVKEKSRMVISDGNEEYTRVIKSSESRISINNGLFVYNYSIGANEYYSSDFYVRSIPCVLVSAMLIIENCALFGFFEGGRNEMMKENSYNIEAYQKVFNVLDSIDYSLMPLNDYYKVFDFVKLEGLRELLEEDSVRDIIMLKYFQDIDNVGFFKDVLSFSYIKNYIRGALDITKNKPRLNEYMIEHLIDASRYIRKAHNQIDKINNDQEIKDLLELNNAI